MQIQKIKVSKKFGLSKILIIMVWERQKIEFDFKRFKMNKIWNIKGRPIGLNLYL